MAVDEDLDEVVKEFLVESYENLDQLDRDLVALEKDPGSTDTLSSVFRTIHTIKGTCGFLGFGRLESVAHVGESLLSRLRDGRLTLNADITSGLLAMVDAVRQMLGRIEADGNDGDQDYRELIERLTGLQEALAEAGAAAAPAAAPPTASAAPAPSDACATEPAAAADDERVTGATTPAPAAETAAAAVERTPADAPVAAPPAAPAPTATATPAKTAPATSAPRADAPAEATDTKSAVADTTIRVDVGLLDKLMNLVGELVLARNQILQFTGSQVDNAFVATTQRLNLITTELQEGVMKTRMQPIGNVWSKFPRVVRDLAVACGKRVRIEMDGRETELDKTIIEAIKDPLTHAVRNSVDHGIEAPEVRAAAGKPTEGRIFLRAFHEGGQVNIEISDDGGGIDADKIKQKAVQKGLITSEYAARMGEHEALGLIFLPGFSTAAQVTNVSGRGVGMDVVKTNIEKIGGAVDVQSVLGQGTTLRVKIPLTLAIIPALTITSRGARYAIPQVSLLELVRLEGEQAQKGVEMIHGAPVYRLRGNLLPLIYLNRQLHGADGDEGHAEAVNIVVLQAEERQFGLVVDGINDTEEIVVKPLGKQLKGISTFSGATIMGDGRVALILDVLGLAQTAGVVSRAGDRKRAEQGVDAADAAAQRAAERQSWLLLGVGEGGRLAMPLSEVARLEEFKPSAVEQSGHHEVVQYRGRIMPILRLSNVLGYAPKEVAEDEPLHVVVYRHNGGSVGFVVDEIVDIVEEAVAVKREAVDDGLLASAVIQGRVTDLLDVQALIERVDPSFIEAREAA